MKSYFFMGNCLLTDYLIERATDPWIRKHGQYRSKVLAALEELDPMVHDFIVKNETCFVKK
ncbi:hypothetical protein HZB02_04475 [Candidatus Woesearchaeota archaeon]|nr:hypothetical protein [Candidatus Woesearchaeota archaeon]